MNVFEEEVKNLAFQGIHGLNLSLFAFTCNLIVKVETIEFIIDTHKQFT